VRYLSFLLAFLAALPALADCPLDLGRGTGLVVFSDHYMIAFRPDPPQIEVGMPFALILNVCTRSDQPAELVAIEAQMPEHRHGMNYRPTIIAGKDGRYRVEGLMFHMPGRWELNFDVRSGEETERLSHDILLK
jgi:YtkA-like